MILHLDMDAFFASVEQLDNPELRGKPVIVGGGQRGVVATASYEARVFGVHSAMPIATARKLCPQAVFVPGRHERYSQISRRVMDCLLHFSPLVQKASIDEAYADLTGTEKLHGSSLDLAKALKARVARATGGLTCSVGIAPVKFLAKICSDIRKPDGIFLLEPEEVDDFLLDLPVDRLPGVGKHMSASLAKIGITSVRGLRMLSRSWLEDRYGKWGLELYDRARGRDNRKVVPNPPAKSESSERTFEKDILDHSLLRKSLREQAERVGASLRKNGCAGRTVTLKIKFANFRQITRSKTIEHRTNVSQTIFEIALKLFEATPLPLPVRLLGVGVSGFDNRPEQLFLPGILPTSQAAPLTETRRLALENTLDRISGRFGRGAIRRGG